MFSIFGWFCFTFFIIFTCFFVQILQNTKKWVLNERQICPTFAASKMIICFIS